MLKLMRMLFGIVMKKKCKRTSLYKLNYLKKKLRKKTRVNLIHLRQNKENKNYYHQSILQYD